jgi:hypothetical protein
MKRITIFIIVINCIFIDLVRAIPVASEVDSVEGNIVSWVYREKIKYSRTVQELSVEYEIPSHYIVMIKNVTTSDKESLKFADKILGTISFTDHIFLDQENEYYFLHINSDQINPLLINGSNIKITGYKIKELNGLIVSEYKELSLKKLENTDE